MSDQNESFDLNVLREMFRNEAYELIGELENALLALEEEPRDKDAINRVFRALHTIKGSGGACGFDDVARFAHEVEALYDAARNDKLTVTKEIVNLTLAARDQFEAPSRRRRNSRRRRRLPLPHRPAWRPTASISVRHGPSSRAAQTPRTCSTSSRAWGPAAS
jgi:chemotaxis protein histidine kinase CheA